MRIVSLIVLGALVAGCSTTPPPPEIRTVETQAKLNKALAGLVPGRPQSCLPHYAANDMVVIDDNTLLFRNGGSHIYRNDFSHSGCPMLSGNNALVTRNSTASLCQGDIARVVDLHNGITVGSCVLGDFVPYTRP